MSHIISSRCLILLLAMVVLSMPAGAQQSTIKPLAQRAKVRIALSPGNTYPLPILYAQEKDYFSRSGIDLELTKYNQAAVTLAPMLARGDFDIAPQTPAPAFYNLVAQGFGARAVSTFSQPKAGRADVVWISVAPDMVGKIKDYADLRGKVVEGAAIGATANFAALVAIQRGGLTQGKDVTLQLRVRSSGDFVVLAKNRMQDAIGLIEPTASQAEKEGYAIRWKSLGEVAPWFQPIIMVSSEQFLQKNPAALQKFLEVYITACREINATNGQWTEVLMRLITQWTGMTPQVIRDMGQVPYFEPNGELSRDSLERAEQIWIDAQALKQKVEMEKLIDSRPLTEVLKIVGRVK